MLGTAFKQPLFDGLRAMTEVQLAGTGPLGANNSNKAAKASALAMIDRED